MSSFGAQLTLGRAYQLELAAKVSAMSFLEVCMADVHCSGLATVLAYSHQHCCRRQSCISNALGKTALAHLLSSHAAHVACYWSRC